MAINKPDLYMNDTVGLGKPAMFQGYEADTAVAGETLEFGVPVENKGGIVSNLKDEGGVFFGITIARHYAKDLTEKDAEKWAKGETLPVMRKGTIAVEAGATLEIGDRVKVSAGKFVKSETREGSVGTVKRGGNENEIIYIQINE